MDNVIMAPVEPRKIEKELQKMSPFEVKNKLIELAGEPSKANCIFLNAGRGNPNWIATIAREAFFVIGKFGIEECRRVMDEKEGIAGIPQLKGISKRFEDFLKKEKKSEALDLLKETYNYYLEEKKVDADMLVHEWAEAVIGDQYPVPDRILKFNEIILQDYIEAELSYGKKVKGKFDMFATEGGTAGMCYVFDSLQQNFLIDRGDQIALMVPIFTPYIEIPELDRFNFKVHNITASCLTKEGYHTWQYPDSEIDKLKDPNVRILFIVNPSNPPSVAMDKHTADRIIKIVKHDNPNLMIVTDDVYAPFVPGFRSLMYELPYNTICVYSFSKYFGATGWRLAVVAIHENNVFDDQIAKLPEAKIKRLNKRYGSLTLEPQKMKFIDRMVADSRMVALNHTAGLSTPQQMQMTLFASMSLLDTKNRYREKLLGIVRDRLETLWKNTGFKLIPDPLRAGYYAEIDLIVWATKYHGEEFAAYLQKNYEPLDFLLRLAKEDCIVLLNGDGFDGPAWSIRASLANLDQKAYERIGISIRETLQEYADAWEQKKNK